jgi:hypothetical protein
MQLPAVRRWFSGRPQTITSRSMRRLSVTFATAALLAGSIGSAPAALASNQPDSTCQIQSEKGGIEHVIYLQFDNTHFLRDNPNVPSDLEQMPHLLNFLRDNGTLFTNDHTMLISHTGGGILSTLTGLYPDRHGQAVSNSYRYFKGDGTTASSSSFKYWTDLVDDTGSPPADPLPNMVNGDTGTPRNAPAPWVPYTRAGCDFGAAAVANVVLENTGTGPNGDMTKVFGQGSEEWNEAVASNTAPAATAARALAQTDFVGMAIHCGAGGGICKDNPKARPDLLPDEAGGYNGYLGLFGAKYVNPAINDGNATMNDLAGHPISDPFGQPGFPGFDGLFASTTLSYIATMQEAGIPITFGYISDAHDGHGAHGEQHIAYGPGQQEYVDQLKAYDDAFAAFFDRLASDGINKSNTLFVVTVEEGDHFVGAHPTPAGCDGVTVACTYSLLGEVNGNLQGLLSTQQGITTPFTVHSDMAPTIYLTGNPARTAPVTREFGRALARLRTTNPYTGNLDDLTRALADPVEMKALHMVTADPQRTPTLTMFAHPDYFLFASATACNVPAAPPCITVPTTPPTFAWNHGSIEPEIATTWVGYVGPGIRHRGQDDTTWTDHTDVRPTILSLLGLSDTYVLDGRVVVETLEPWAIPTAIQAHVPAWRSLARTYKAITAPFGEFGQRTLAVSTAAIRSGSASDDAVYANLEGRLEDWTARRDALAAAMRSLLNASAFDDKAISQQQANQLISSANALLEEVRDAGS